MEPNQTIESRLEGEDLLSRHRVGNHEVYYLPGFLTDEEEAYLLRKINGCSDRKWKHLSNRRLQVYGGELTPKHILIPQAMPDFLATYPNLISRLKATGVFDASPHQQPNHVILNEYYPGQGIMPHEDGPAYHPIVATISLGCYTFFHYYKYNDEAHPGKCPEKGTSGRTIGRVPVLTLLLEPRSLIVTKGSLYTDHLHGINDNHEDRISLSSDGLPLVDGLGVLVDNWDLVADAELKQVLREGGSLRRATRYSLTCRDVEHVSKAKHPLLR